MWSTKYRRIAYRRRFKRFNRKSYGIRRGTKTRRTFMYRTQHNITGATTNITKKEWTHEWTNECSYFALNNSNIYSASSDNYNLPLKIGNFISDKDFIRWNED